MTIYDIPRPPDDLAQVWDAKGVRWMRRQTGSTPARNTNVSGGWWADEHSRFELRWVDLILGHGPVSTTRLRCAVYLKLEGQETRIADADWEMLQCVGIPGHDGHHQLDVAVLRWDDEPQAKT